MSCLCMMMDTSCASGLIHKCATWQMTTHPRFYIVLKPEKPAVSPRGLRGGPHE